MSVFYLKKGGDSLRDVNDLLQSFKKASMEAYEASQPSDFCFGKVTSVAPLQILVEQKMTLGAAQLVLTRNVTDFMTLVSFDWLTEMEQTKHKHKVENVDDPSMKLECEEVEQEHSHEMGGTKSIIIHNALQIGDEVILLKRKGGQKYLVIDRVVTAT